jgi:hypothetical protein
MGRGHRELSHGMSHSGLSHKIESQIESSHEEYVTVGPVAVAPVTKSTSRWVQSVGPVSGSSHKKQVMRCPDYRVDISYQYWPPS